MIPRRRYFIKNSARLFDIVALLCSFIWVVEVVTASTGMTLTGFLEMRVKLGNSLLLGLMLVVWHVLFSICGLYTSKRLTSQLSQIAEVAKAVTLATLFLFIAAGVFHKGLISPRFVLLFWLATTTMMVVGRVGTRFLLLALRSRGRNRRFILIVGTNERAINFAQQIREHPELGYQIVGFVDDDWDGIEAFGATGHKRCSTFASLAAFLRYTVVDEAAIYLPLRSYYEHAAELVAICERHGIALRFDSQVFSLRGGQSKSSDLDDARLLTNPTLAELVPSAIKRCFDFAFSSLLLILLSPLFLIVAILVKVSSRGPIMFRQIRVGLNKRQFTMYKFRTMVANAEELQEQLLKKNEMSGPVFKIANDPRITPVGRFLRKMSIDEFPQLFNVLTGEMSLVGPRPMSMRDYQMFDQDWQHRRFGVKPGITCLWQIRGRNSIPFEEWMELDMQYIDKWSLWLDLKILARTVPAVLRGTGAA